MAQHGRSTPATVEPLGFVRTLYVVDIENLGCWSHLTYDQVAWCHGRVFTLVPATLGDQTVIAASGHNAEAMSFGWSTSAVRRIRSGVDGADHELLDALSDVRWVASRFEQVIVCSGDYIFAAAVAALKAAGLQVIVVSPSTSISLRMRLAAGPDLIYLDLPSVFGTAPEPHSPRTA
jgi:hypothetical protein